MPTKSTEKAEHEADRTSSRLRFRRLRGSYAIARLAPGVSVPVWSTGGEFTSITRTAEELSVVCPARSVPSDVPCQRGWACFKLEGPFPFSQTGVLLAFIKPLSENGVPIFAISTYDTDYVLIQGEFVERAVGHLREAGHELFGGDDSGRKQDG